MVMDNVTSLPFKVGDLAEAKSFESGYRGAWFRCKILKIYKQKGDIGHVLEYYDFPDEKPKWAKFYQAPPHYVGKKHKELIVRPQYPPILNNEQIPDPSLITEVTIIVDGTWKVGDLVDWWTTGCFWSGRIIQLLSDGQALMKLKQPPLGEGSVYEVLLKDLRPSLDWSPDHGWTIPFQEDESARPCARLIKPANQVTGQLLVMDSHKATQETEAGRRAGGSLIGLRFSPKVTPSNSLAVSDGLKSKEKAEMDEKLSQEGKNVQGESMSVDLGDTSHVRTNSEQTGAVIVEGGLNFTNHFVRGRAGAALNSSSSNTIEAAVLDLQRTLNKVKMLQTILRNGTSSSMTPPPRWLFVPPSYSDDDPESPETKYSKVTSPGG